MKSKWDKHEIHDSVHKVIRLDSTERIILDTMPVQRLRKIKQLGCANKVYPSANHVRFEHSLGVMYLAGRIYDVIVHKYGEDFASILPHPNSYEYSYWKRVVRLGALLHDIGHFPFSHIVEKAKLVSDNHSHEHYTAMLILNELDKDIRNIAQIDPADVAKIAVGSRVYKEVTGSDEDFSDLENLLSEIVTSDYFGSDRIDYLVRDNRQLGTSYVCDHETLISSICVLKWQDKPMLGIDEAGLHAAESLLTTRQLLYNRLVFHPVILSIESHMADFMRATYANGGTYLPQDITFHQQLTDSEVEVEISRAVRDPSHSGHKHAKRIELRQHFRLLYKEIRGDAPYQFVAIYNDLKNKFGEENVITVERISKNGVPDFPVYTKWDDIRSSLEISSVIPNLPDIGIRNIFVAPELFESTKDWLDKQLPNRTHPRI